MSHNHFSGAGYTAQGGQVGYENGELLFAMNSLQIALPTPLNPLSNLPQLLTVDVYSDGKLEARSHSG